MFQFTAGDKEDLGRTTRGSELELRFSDHEKNDFSQERYTHIVNYLRRNSTQAQKQEYTNYSYTIQNQTYRVTKNRVTGLREVMTKENLRGFGSTKSQLRKHFIPFSMRLGEAMETKLEGFDKGQILSAIDKQPLPRGVALNTTREITRETYTVQGLSFECSVVVNTYVRGPQVTTYEIELELQANPVDEAQRAIEIIYKASMPEELRNNLIMAELQELSNDLIRVRQLANDDSKEFELGFAVNPVNLPREEIPQLNNFAMTNKLDGERKFLIHLNAKYRLLVINPRGFQKGNPASAYYLPVSRDLPEFIFDAEQYQGIFYVFDVAYYQGALDPFRQSSLMQRMQIAAQVSLPGVQQKTFYYGTLQQNLQAFMRANDAEDWYHSSDGLIFTVKEASYKRSTHYKFKFPSKMSIDFAVALLPQRKENQNEYRLMVSEQGKLKYFGDHRLVSYEDYRDKIIECVYYKGRWVAIRHRKDKVMPNAVRTAENVWRDIQNPIPLHQLVQDQDSEFLGRIAILEKNFLADLVKTENRLIFQALDLFPGQIAYVLSRLGQWNTKQYMDCVNHYITTSAKFPNMDFIQKISTCMEEKYYPYANTEELSIITEALPGEGLVVDDIRTNLSVPLQNIGSIINLSYHANLRSIQIPEDPSYREVKFSPSIISQDAAYDRYVAMEKVGSEGQLDRISNYSSLMPWHRDQVSEALLEWFPVGTLKEIVDMTAHVGIDSLLFKSLYNCKVHAFEIHPNIYKALVKNCQGSGIQTYNMDSCYQAYLYWPYEQFDMVYIDAPWGGPDYKQKQNLDLFMQAEGEAPIPARNIVSVARFILSQRKAKAVVIKVPSNYNMEGLSIFDWQEKNILNKGNISYKLIRLLPRVGVTRKQTDVLLWSVPYTDDTDRIFKAGHQTVVVRSANEEILDTVVQLQYEWHMVPLSSAPCRLLDENTLLRVAARNGYQHEVSYDKSGFRYSRFRKGQLPQPQKVQMPAYAPPQPQKVQMPAYAPPQPQKVQMPAYGPSQKVSQQLAANLQKIIGQPNILPAFGQKPSQPAVGQKRYYSEAEAKDSLYYVKKYHNQEKKNLINLYCKGRSVLDLGAGFGGDLSKYEEAEVTRLVLVEPNETNIKQPEGLEDRLSNMKIKSRTTIIPTRGQDTERILAKVMEESRVQVVSSFFSMSFLFESIDNLRDFLRTVNVSLQEGGYFIGTMMDGDKAHKAFLGKDEIQYDTVSVKKRYKDSDPKAFGQKLWINIKDSIVVNQDEYLAYFDFLQQELERLGFKLELRYDFYPEGYIDYQKIIKINPAAAEFSKLNISFVFRKMPQKLSLKEPGLAHDKVQEFFNLYGEMTPMYRTGVMGDGSCFYHSYLLSMMGDEYLGLGREERIGLVKTTREQFSDWITVERFVKHVPSMVFQHLQSLFDSKIAEYTTYLPEYRQYVPEKFPGESLFLVGFYSIPDDPLKSFLWDKLREYVIDLKRKVKQTSKFSESEDIRLFMEYTGVNIYLIQRDTRFPREEFLPSYKASRKESIVLLYIPGHYESLFFGVKTKDGKLSAKRKLQRFDPQLLNLHQWLIKKRLNKTTT